MLYLGHRGYQNTLTTLMNFYHSPNLKKEVVNFVKSYLDCQHVNAECKHTTSLLQTI